VFETEVREVERVIQKAVRHLTSDDFGFRVQVGSGITAAGVMG